ncbi:ArgE/DapE family deacylase [uncultured Secundilactobacillus sp.]|uniref:ArgE/DapE family deacylase n=1 Tax=uncultured Secundilactobacillus sp. TaxID=2813935 RepID=UPI002583196C|nr:ArgE/DapE family deacylase [uncultured Secundilactobacillus sp.]
MEKEAELNILRDLIKIQTPNSNELRVAEYIGKLFDAHGISYYIDKFDDDPTRANLVAEIGEKETDDVLAFAGHQDTVAITDPDDWTHDPFDPVIEGDKLYGRGAADMKSGLAAQIIALIDLADSGVKIPGTLRFIATAGEEYGTPGAWKLNAAGVVKDVSALVIGEPTGGDVIYAHSGSMNYKVVSHGTAVHSSTPELGVNAIKGLNAFINAEDTLFDDAGEDPYLGHVKHSITLISGGDQVNILPDHAELWGNIRPTETFNNDQVIEHLESAIRQLNDSTPFNLELTITHNFLPVETEPDNEFVQLVKTASDNAYAADDRTPKLDTINGATDASVFVTTNDQMPVVIFGADQWDKAHQVNEYTTLSSFYATIDGYEEIAKKYFEVKVAAK